MRAWVLNQSGADVSRDFRVSYYYCPSSHPHESTGCTHLLDKTPRHDFRARSGTAIDARMTVPRTVERGVHSIFVEADSDNVIRESDEGNNSDYATLSIDAHPDLEITDASVGAPTAIGDTATVRYTVSNHDQAVEGPIWISIHACSSDDVSTCYRREVYKSVGVDLIADETRTFSETFAAPSRYVRVRVDANDGIRESNERNNGEMVDLRPGT